MSKLKSLIKKIPSAWYTVLRRTNYALQIKNNRFVSPEKEFPEIRKWISEGDWVLDIGANVGHYTRAFSSVVGSGRVVALEPHPETFSYLACNTADLSNVTLINAAATDSNELVGFAVPEGNFYTARITKGSERKVLGLQLGALQFPQRISFVKIDVEGHEMHVLNSLEDIIQRDSPILMVENHLAELQNWAAQRGYFFDDLANSHNHILKPMPDRSTSAND
ncbi:MAG: hypothetical protein CL583_05205 [Alteromonadaceae bacterium]|nr:hypothetical protein [Alteromonadaceae bacterium]|tara:strand:- start:3921 stop:4586 length:666 start_codon:yes stop_codon:yes gene_type:complete